MRDYTRLRVAAGAPPTVRLFVQTVADVYIADIHAMLRLPLPQLGIGEACNLTIASALLGFISGVSVIFYEPPSGVGRSRRLFLESVSAFYPWDTEPSHGVRDPALGAELLYESFRNPLAHSLGHHEQRVRAVVRIPAEGLGEQELEMIETAIGRPADWVLHNQPTLKLHASGGVSLYIEPFYWGVREMVRRVTSDTARMAAAEAHLA